jgi:hypothetical protein
VPILVVLASLGAGSYLGGWYAGLAGSPVWAPHGAPPFDRPERIDVGAGTAERTEYIAKVRFAPDFLIGACDRVVEPHDAVAKAAGRSKV